MKVFAAELVNFTTVVFSFSRENLFPPSAAGRVSERNGAELKWVKTIVYDNLVPHLTQPKALVSPTATTSTVVQEIK